MFNVQLWGFSLSFYFANDPKPHASAFPQPDPFRQRQIRFKLEGKAQHLDAFVLHEFFADQFGDAHVEAARHRPVDAAGEGQDVAGEDVFQKSKPFGDPLQLAVLKVVFGIERLPVVQAVGKVAFPDVEGVLVDVQVRNAHRQGLIGHTAIAVLAQFERPVGLTEKVVGFFDPLVEAKQQRAKAAVVRRGFVLDQRIAVVEAAGFVVVIVEPFVFQADFPGHGAAKPR